MEEQKKEDHKHEHHAVHHKAGSKDFKLDANTIILGLIVILVVVMAVNVATSLNIGSQLKDKAQAAEEAAKPAKIGLAVITDSKCSDCTDIAPYVDFIKSSKVEITGEKTLEISSVEAKNLISKYGIKKIPSLVITGEIEKVKLDGFDNKDDALVLADISAPYTNTANGKIEGRVIAYYLLDPSCTKCNDLGPLIQQIKFSGVGIVEQKNLSIASGEGAALVQKYKMGFAPAFILSKEASVYPLMAQAWPQIGTIEDDGSYVLRTPYPPFINLTTKETRGIVDIIYLGDKSCTECYNVSMHKEILGSPQSFGIKIEREETFDISSAKGKELIARYNLTQVPTVIVSKEVSVYPSSEGLKQFFSVEKDGSFVFRAPNVLGNYRDLASNEIIKPQPQQ